MSQLVYSSAAQYFAETNDDLKAQIARMIAVRNAMTAALLNAAGLGDVQEYLLNDGQTIIKSVQRSPEQITKSINSIDYVIKRLERQINGSSSQLIDGKNLNYFSCGY